MDRGACRATVHGVAKSRTQPNLATAAVLGHRTSLAAQMVKNLPATQEIRVQSLGWEDSLDKGMAIRSSILPGEFHGQRSLVGYSPWGPKELDATERLALGS